MLLSPAVGCKLIASARIAAPASVLGAFWKLSRVAKVICYGIWHTLSFACS